MYCICQLKNALTYHLRLTIHIMHLKTHSLRHHEHHDHHDHHYGHTENTFIRTDPIQAECVATDRCHHWQVMEYTHDAHDDHDDHDDHDAHDAHDAHDDHDDHDDHDAHDAHDDHDARCS